MLYSTIGLLAFLTEAVGLSIGFLLFYGFKVTHKRLIGMLYGVTSGIMIAMICFDLLPEAMHMGKEWLVVVGVGIGLAIGVSLDEIGEGFKSKSKKGSQRIHTTGYILLIGIAVHSFPEGFVLGTMCINAPENLSSFLMVIGLHSIPEAIALAVPFKWMKVPMKWVVTTPFIIGMMMGSGAILGSYFAHTATVFIPLTLGVAAGVILYIVCEELIPESRKIWNGRMTSIATILGIILGMFMMHA